MALSNKVLAMALAELLLGGDAKRPAWVEAGTVMIAIDTLVHHFLQPHRHSARACGRARQWVRLLRAERLRRNDRKHRRLHRRTRVQSRLPRRVPPFRCSMRFGASVPKMASIAATATASMIAPLAPRRTVRSGQAARVCR